MVSSTKSLKVAYGKFSCTAEGFEDPLAIVKETAALFHSMVQGDRFFGTESLPSHEDLIERLARRNISAEQSADGLKLRPAVSAEGTTAPAPGPAEDDRANPASPEGQAGPDPEIGLRGEDHADDLGPDADDRTADTTPVEAAFRASKGPRIDTRLDRVRAAVLVHSGSAVAAHPAPDEHVPGTPMSDSSGPHENTATPPAGSATDTPEVRTRVLKIPRADFEKALAEGRLENVESETDRVAELSEDKPPQATALTPEEEMELARELEKVRAELDNEWEYDRDQEAMRLSEPSLYHDDPTNNLARPASDRPEDLAERLGRETMRSSVKLSSRGRALLTRNSVDEGDNTSRLLHETNREMAEPEGNRRRSAIAHLRAAVAATRADRLLGRKPDEDKAVEPYREVLATVVRPRRPQPPAHNPLERPTQCTTVWRADDGPLTLVPRQQGETRRPESPLLLRGGDLTGTDLPGTSWKPVDASDTGFSDYIEKVGACTLSERLEAAAAYISFVEGRDQFSRPQLMAMLRLADPEDTSREDRLQSFGQLLRDGKIEKTRGGRFTASDLIGFKPPKTQAG